jgi:hypothetical protein
MKMGRIVTAIVAENTDAELTEAALIAFTKQHTASYQAPNCQEIKPVSY